jgi:zinc transporter ZupT
VQEVEPILMRVVFAFGLAVAGGVLSAAVGFSHRRLCALISLAAGTLLGVTIFSIVPEAIHVMGWWKMAVALVSGYAVFFLISKYVYHVCPACAASHFDEASTHRFREIAVVLIIALAIHSTMDGVALAAGHEAGGELDSSMLAAVSIHKFPEGLALGALLLGAGYRRPAAVGWVAAVETTTLVGGVIGYLVLRGDLTAEKLFWVGAVLAHVGGGFLFLAAHAVLGEMLKHGKTIVFANFAAGLLVIAGVNWAVRLL